MKKSIFRLMSLMLTLSVITWSCTDEDDPEPEVVNLDTDQGANDQTASDEIQEAFDNVFDALDDDTTEVQTGRVSGTNGVVLPCGAVKVTRTSTGYTFDYGDNCGVKKLSGSVSVQLITGNTWADAGAQISMTFNEYEAEFQSNGEVLTFNGTLIVTNVDGGRLYEVTNFFGNSPKVITHTIDGTVKITFDRNDERDWVITKKRVFESVSGDLKDITGKLMANGANNVAEAGTSRDGDPYTMTISDAITWEVCNDPVDFDDDFEFRITRGQLRKTIGIQFIDAQFGYEYVDQFNGNLVNNCNADAARLSFSFTSAVFYQKY